MSFTTEYLRPPLSVSRRPKWRVALHRIRCTLGTWSERMRQRRQLAGMSDQALRDIAISRVDALREAEKPFWRG